MTFNEFATFRYRVKKLRGRMLLLALCSAFCVACGVKTLPVAPSHKTPPAVRNLEYGINAERVVLTWQLPDTDKTGKNDAKVSWFQVYRSKVSLDKPDCETCPIRFRKIARVDAGPRNLKDRLQKKRSLPLAYGEALQQGYRYIYKVTAHADSGAAGGDSNYVEFSY